MVKLSLFSLGFYLWGVAVVLDLYWSTVKRHELGELLAVSLLSWSGVAWVVAIALNGFQRKHPISTSSRKFETMGS